MGSSLPTRPRGLAVSVAASGLGGEGGTQVMTLDIHVEWDGGAARSTSERALDRLLDELHAYAQATEPFVVEVCSENGEVLGIGLGDSETILLWSPAALEQPQLSSRGTGSGTGTATFRLSGRPVEYRADQLISIASGRAAVRHFSRTGRLSHAIEWQEA